MIYIYPIGGLGNMFFHIASIWSLAKDNNDELCLLNIDEKIINLINDKRYVNNICNLKHAEKYRYIFNRLKCLNINITQQLNYPFFYVPLIYKNEHQYVGYFQCEKYFKHRRNEILELFRPADEFNNEINKYSNLFNSISLHVRRGDYINSRVFYIMSTEYYQKALSFLPKDALVVIFSDDINWCKQIFIGERFVFINEIDYIVMYLMSKMKYHIITNSSFSWWGAWLSNSEKVIAPLNYVKENYVDTKDLIPENWIKI